jgi:hypothetical protein
MNHTTRSTGTAFGRGRLTKIVGWCGLFLLSTSFAAMPLVVSAHDGGTGGGDRTVAVEKRGNDGSNHDLNDDRGDDGPNHDANDDRGMSEPRPIDDHGVDANGMPITLVPIRAGITSGR